VPSAPHRLSREAGSTEALRRQSRYWNARYRLDPALFGSERSPFLDWVLSSLKGHRVGRTWVELGAGYGRDLRELQARGYSAHGVDVSHFATTLAREAGLKVVREPAVRFLGRWEEGAVDVVVSNLFFNMEFSEADHEQLFAGIYRALAPGGYHAYSVRTVSDRWYGKGVLVGPDTFDLAPDGPVMHFFSRKYARHLRQGRFRNVRAKEGTEDPGGFPIRVLYVLDQKRPTGRH
jgi:SAM-dependent methyltransferase